MKKTLLSFVAISLATTAIAAPIKIKGVLNNNRYDDGEQLKSEYVGWDSDLQKAIYIVDFGIYALTWDGEKISTPVKEPDVKRSDLTTPEKKTWATNFNLMYGNSGAVHVGDKIVTVMSRDYQSTEDNELFAVRKWDANTGDLLNDPNEFMHVNSNIESAGMSYNPMDNKVYGFFHITDAKLLDDILNDPDYFEDADDTDSGREGLDDGYCLGTIDLATMKITPITPGLYYGNFVSFAINSEGRAFVLTSGGVNGYLDENGKMRNIDGELTGAQLIEIDTKTGLMKRELKEKDDTYYYEYPLKATGYCSQVHRQAACFAKSDPNKLYWIGFYNSGKGINSNGSWTGLNQKEWRTNGLYDTALYVIDVTTGECERLAKIPTRASYSCIWIDGDDPSENADVPTGIDYLELDNEVQEPVFYNLQGQKVSNPESGIYIISDGKNSKKVFIR